MPKKEKLPKQAKHEKQQKKRKGRSVQDFIGVKTFTKYGLMTQKGELLFYLVSPTNISVLSYVNIEIKIRHLMMVLSSIPDIEITCTDSSECFDDNKAYLHERLEYEQNPKVRKLIKKDIEFLDNVQVEMATARQFLFTARIKASKDKQVFDTANRVEKIISEQGFEVRRMRKADIKRFLALYFEASMNGEQMEDITTLLNALIQRPEIIRTAQPSQAEPSIEQRRLDNEIARTLEGYDFDKDALREKLYQRASLGYLQIGDEAYVEHKLKNTLEQHDTLDSFDSELTNKTVKLIKLAENGSVSIILINDQEIGFCLLADEIGGVLVLAGALRADHAVLTEVIHTLAAVDRMMIGGRQRICDVPLIPDSVAAVLRLPVDGVSRDAEGFFLFYERHIVAACSVSCGHGGRHLMRAGVAGINAMVFVDKRLVSMLLRPQSTGHILRALHHASALIIQTQDGWHAVSAGRAFQRRRQFLAVPNAPSRGTGSR